MPCVAVGCSNKQKNNLLSTVKFYRFPKDDLRQREAWIRAVRRENWHPSPHSRLCSSHFITGHSSTDPSHPDWAPSIFLHTNGQHTAAKAANALQRYKRSFLRTRTASSPTLPNSKSEASQFLSDNNSESVLSDIEHNDSVELTARTDSESVDVSEENVSEPVHVNVNLQTNHAESEGIECTVSVTSRSVQTEVNICRSFAVQTETICSTASNQTEVSGDIIKQMEEKIKALEEQNQGLRNVNAMLLKNVESIRFSVNIDNDEQIKLYTGLPNAACFKSFFDHFVSKYKPHVPCCSLSQENQFLLTLMKLRCGFTGDDLAHRFQIQRPRVSTVFHRWLDILAEEFKGLIIWPSKHACRKNLPEVFRTAEFRATRTIIDCTEIFIERPSCLVARAQTYSNYKHHNTVKFLICITPCGAICFISKAYGGRISDKEVTAQCGFLDLLEQNDMVLADRGFLIDELVAAKGAKLAIPAFTRGKSQLGAEEVESSRRLSRVRIHVERAIGRLRNFVILKSTLPISLVKRDSDVGWCTIDKIMTVCAGICNLLPPLVS